MCPKFPIHLFHSRFQLLDSRFSFNMTPSKILFFLCLSFITGIFLQSIIKIPQTFVWGILFLGISIIFISLLISPKKRRSSLFWGYEKMLLVVGFCLFSLVLGIMRFQISEFAISRDQLKALNDQPEKITLTGQIVGEPDVRATSQKLKVQINQTKSLALVTTIRYPEYRYLETIKMTGKLKTPAEFNDFNYRDYLMKDGIYSVMDYPVIEKIPTKIHYTPATFLYEKLLFFKGKLHESINQNFSPPHSALLEGILLGGTSGMDKETKSKMSAVGLTHLTAISGSNVVILSTILMAFLLLLGFWRGQAFYLSATFIWLYVAIAAFPASGVRAAIMGSIFLLAQKLGRQNTTSRVIVLAAALMLFQNPTLLFYDIGFQLSFLASLGIIYGKPLFDYFFRFIENKKVKGFADIFSITLAAQIITLPVIAYNFKQISLVAPLTNLLVIPIIDWIMISGLVAVILGIFSSGLGFIAAIPCWFLLSYFLKVMDIFYQPWAAYPAPNIPVFFIVAYYAGLAATIWFLNKKLKPQFLGF